MARRPDEPGELPRAAQYLRMSTEHQRYSIDSQAATIAHFARTHGFAISRTYRDDGVSGLTIQKRKGLQQLLADVVGGHADFQVILVYDVSRWGRFQNPDQSAHYEFLCAEAGIRVEYCAELFPNDGSAASTILKGLKRVMAAEYSRELSTKISAARSRLLENGHWHGSRAGYGLRRQMIGPDGKPGAILEFGQAKAIQDHHSRLVPGPPVEIAVVQRIYRMFVVARLTRTAISRVLNDEGVPSETGQPWSYNTVRQILSNPKYIGELVSNRTTGRLGAPRITRDAADWFRKPGAFKPIVSRDLFDAAQKLIAARHSRLDRAALIAIAMKVYDRHGALTLRGLDDMAGSPGYFVFKNRFGSLQALYAAIDRTPPGKPYRSRKRLDNGEALRRLSEVLSANGFLSYDLVNLHDDLPSVGFYRGRFGSLTSAYALIGYVALTPEQSRSPVGRARLAAAVARASGKFPVNEPVVAPVST